ncbi:DUF4249 domain-containing protein [Fibrella arboris]|uniref:DUF4249 domain-containing protein n=1 Tax=Fibrella arboris TaxID=3242486 RepID=UPI0035228584
MKRAGHSVVLLALLVAACVEPAEPEFNATVNVIVVDGTITNLPEAQIVAINRSKADSLTGRFGSLPVTKARVEVVIDSSRVIAYSEIRPGTYQLPDGFRAEPGHAYQVRFTTAEGTRYQSDQQVMPAAVPIQNYTVQFNANSLPGTQYGGLQAGHDVAIDTQDPAGVRNYYRWDWLLYERQDWCRSCYQGVYAVYGILPRTYIFGSYFVSGDKLYENCFVPPFTTDPSAPQVSGGYWYYDYECRTRCWEIIRSYSLNLFDDTFSNGGLISSRRIAQLPFFQRTGALVQLRQASLTKEAYQYYKLFQQQTQNTGGLADTPPSAMVGNIRNVANSRENVVGFFTASGVAVVTHWLDRKDATGAAPGLFQALSSRDPYPEPSPPYTGERPQPKVLIWGGPPRVPTATCELSDSRTPFKPEGWRD